MILTDFVSVSSPAAGAAVVVTVPTGQNWLVRSLRAVFVTSGTVVNRIPYLSYQLAPGAGVNAVFTWGSPVNLPASTTTILSWMLNSPNQQSAWAELVGIFLPEIWLPQASQIVVNAQGIQAADQFSSITLAVQKGNPRGSF